VGRHMLRALLPRVDFGLLIVSTVRVLVWLCFFTSFFYPRVCECNPLGEWLDHYPPTEQQQGSFKGRTGTL
jgi:hypothetical protein